MSDVPGDASVPSLEETMYALLITNMRIYDTLSALLIEQNAELALNLQEMHASGSIVGPSISYNGLHIFDEQNPASRDEQNASENVEE